MQTLTWNYPENGSVAETLSKNGNFSPLLAQLLANRGLHTIEEANNFLNPNLDNLTDPFSLKGIIESVELIKKALANKEKIVVYGDFDVDGITSTAMLMLTLQELGGNISYYIPHRYHEGYSLNLEAIDSLLKDDIQLIITVDCGISNPQEISYARAKGIKVIVTDHHTAPCSLPEADAIINPKCGDSESPAYMLAGVGVAYKLVQALFKSIQGTAANAEKFLDFVALGTVADMAPLVAENRVLTYFGLKNIEKTLWPGIECLKQVAHVGATVTTQSIGFRLGPRINAAGRLEDASIAVDLLCAPNKEIAQPLANKLDNLNGKRRSIGEKILKSAEALIEADKSLLKNNVLILSAKDWNPGVTGIVASQLIKKHHRPVVMISIEGETARASIRSPEGINIFEPLIKCQDLFINYGGHKEAAGFEILTKNIDTFKERYIQHLHAAITDNDFIPKIIIDMKLDLKNISLELISEIARLAPFGQGNRMPLFAASSIKIDNWRQVGDGSHLKIEFRSNEKHFDGIGFGLGKYAKTLTAHSGAVDIAYSLEVNEWQGQKKPQVSLHDIKLLEAQNGTEKFN